MEKFVTSYLGLLLKRLNEYQKTNFVLVGIRHENFDTNSKIMLDLYDKKTKEKKSLYLYEFKINLLEKIKKDMADKINHNEFEEAKTLMERYEGIESYFR